MGRHVWERLPREVNDDRRVECPRGHRPTQGAEDTVQDPARFKAGHDRRAGREPESVEGEVAGTATRARVRLEHGHAKPGASREAPGNETAETGPNNDDVALFHEKILT